MSIDLKRRVARLEQAGDAAGRVTLADLIQASYGESEACRRVEADPAGAARWSALMNQTRA